MEFFETFWSWLDGQMRLYISDNTAAVAAALEPVLLSLATTYIIIWGLLQITGKIDEPITAGLKRISTLVIVIVLCGQFWFYNDLIVDSFYLAPAQFAAKIVHADDPVKVIDTVWASGSSIAENLWSRGSLFHMEGIDFLVMSYVILILIGTLCVQTMFLIALSKVALSVLLALGPLFIILFLFEQTRHYFTAWIAQLSNYAMVTILTIMVCALILSLVRKYATDTLGLGTGVRVVDALNMLLVCALAIMFMLQVTQIAGSLSGGGTGLNTHGHDHRGWAFARGAMRLPAGMALSLTAIGVRGAVGFTRGLMSPRDSSKEDRQPWSIARNAGFDTKMWFVNRNRIQPER